MKYILKEKYHLFRRSFHLLALFIPVIYYWYGDSLTSFFPITKNELLFFCLILIIILEVIRLKLGILLISQRSYERHQPSALFWTVVGLIVVLYFAPAYGYKDAAFGLPIIWSMAIGDPILGELRRRNISGIRAILLTLPIITLIWVICAYWLNTPLWLSLVFPIIIILSEMIPIKWIDDNFTMLFVPLVISYCLY